jgi:hypothetical protein
MVISGGHMSGDSNWKIKVMILGGGAGLLVGLAAAFLFIKNRPEEEQTHKISSEDGMKLGFGIASFIKLIANLGR